MLYLCRGKANNIAKILMNEDEFQEIMRIQQRMGLRIAQERKVDHKIDIINIITDLGEGGKKLVQVEAVIIEAQMNDIPEREATNLLEELEQDHIIRRGDHGYIQQL